MPIVEAAGPLILATRKLGAYEASKMEADAVFQARAAAHDIPWSIVNPSTVIGDSSTGETDQFLGLAASVTEIRQGAMRVLPGNSRTFVPIVTADYLGRFLGLLPTDETTAGQSYWVLDDNTPALPDLLTKIGLHYQVKVPKARIPIAIIRRLPRSITKADPETLSFLSEDRYPTGPVIAFARRNGLEMAEPQLPHRDDADAEVPVIDRPEPGQNIGDGLGFAALADDIGVEQIDHPRERMN